MSNEKRIKLKKQNKIIKEKEILIGYIKEEI